MNYSDYRAYDDYVRAAGHRISVAGEIVLTHDAAGLAGLLRAGPGERSAHSKKGSALLVAASASGWVKAQKREKENQIQRRTTMRPTTAVLHKQERQTWKTPGNDNAHGWFKPWASWFLSIRSARRNVAKSREESSD